MPRICQITGKKLMSGNNVSHSNRKTKRKFHPNIIDKRFFLPEEDRWIKLRVSAAGLRTINKLGIAEAMKRAKAKGHLS